MFGRFADWIKEKWENADWCVVGRWGCMIGAGLLSLGATIFDNVKKDRDYKEGLTEEIRSRIEKSQDTEA